MVWAFTLARRTEERMSEDGRCRTVLILTDTPDDYGADMERLGLTPLFAPTVSGLLDHLLDNPISGFVLEVQKVMRAQGAERDPPVQGVRGLSPCCACAARPRHQLHRRPGPLPEPHPAVQPRARCAARCGCRCA